MEFEKMTLDDLLENLPNNLHIAKNDNAPEHDRWRIYNCFTQKYIEPGFSNVRDLLIYICKRLEEQRIDWIEN